MEDDHDLLFGRSVAKHSKWAAQGDLEAVSSDTIHVLTLHCRAQGMLWFLVIGRKGFALLNLPARHATKTCSVLLQCMLDAWILSQAHLVQLSLYVWP